MAAIVHNPTNSQWGFLFCTDTFLDCFLIFALGTGIRMRSQNCFDLHFHNCQGCAGFETFVSYTFLLLRRLYSLFEWVVLALACLLLFVCFVYIIYMLHSLHNLVRNLFSCIFLIGNVAFLFTQLIGFYFLILLCRNSVSFMHSQLSIVDESGRNLVPQGRVQQ